MPATRARNTRIAITVAVLLLITLLFSVCTRVSTPVEFLSCNVEGRSDRAVLIGHVADIDGDPIVGAVAELGDLATATTDADGRFEMTALVPGRHHLQVDADGYRGLDVDIDLPGCTSGVNLVLRTDGVPFFGPVFGPYL